MNPHEGFMAQLEAFDVKLNGEREAAIADGQEKKVRTWPVCSRCTHKRSMLVGEWQQVAET